MDWINVFSNLFFTFTNNFKLIQFHYKLWHRISTCRYMRHKMKIEQDGPICSLCNRELETLQHIFLKCKYTDEFIGKVNHFIVSNIDRSYKDTHRHYRITLNHLDQRVNFVNAVANWYLSKMFQNKTQPTFVAFTRQLKLYLLGEKPHIVNGLGNIIP